MTTALTNSGFKFPMGRCTINLAPADVKKEGPTFYLPIAVGILAACDELQSDAPDNFIMVGELALTGAVQTAIDNLPIVWRVRMEIGPKTHRTTNWFFQSPLWWPASKIYRAGYRTG